MGICRWYVSVMFFGLDLVWIPGWRKFGGLTLNCVERIGYVAGEFSKEMESSADLHD